MKNIDRVIQGFLWKGILVSILFFILGLVLLINPALSVLVIAYTIGIILIINGISYLLESSSKVLFYDPMLIGIMSLILGVVIIIKPDIFTIMIPVMLGIWFVIYGIIKYKFSVILSEVKANGWGMTLASSLFTICSGVILMIFPRIGIASLVFMMGVLLIVYSISDIINFFIVKKRVNDIANYFK